MSFGDVMKGTAAAAGAVVVVLGGIGSYHVRLPEAHIEGNVAPGVVPDGQTGKAPPLVLALFIKCTSDISKPCLSGLHEFVVPGLEEPRIQPTDLLGKKISKPVSRGKDKENRDLYAYQVMSSLRDGETIGFYVPVNGKVDWNDISILSLSAENLVAGKALACNAGQLQGKEISRFRCREQHGFTDRLKLFLPNVR